MGAAGPDQRPRSARSAARQCPAFAASLSVHRKRLLIGLGGTVALLLFVFFRGATAMHSGNGSTAQAILAHYFMLVIWMTALALVVVIQITVMTRRILRAIELASKQ